VKAFLIIALVFASSCREHGDSFELSDERSVTAAVAPLTNRNVSLTCGERIPGGHGGGGLTSAGGGLVEDSSGLQALTQDKVDASPWNEIVLSGTGIRMTERQLPGGWKGGNGVAFHVRATEPAVFEDPKPKVFDLRCYWQHSDRYMSCYGPDGGAPGVFTHIKGFNALKMNIQLPIKGQRSFGSGLLSVRVSQRVADSQMVRFYSRTRELECDVH
jgi:hypothetical protein